MNVATASGHTLREPLRGVIWLAVFATALVFPLLVVVGRIEDRHTLTGADRALKA